MKTIEKQKIIKKLSHTKQKKRMQILRKIKIWKFSRFFCCFTTKSPRRKTFHTFLFWIFNCFLQNLAQLSNEIREREAQDNLLRQQYGYDIGQLRSELENERLQRDKERDNLQNQIDDLTKELADTKENLQCQIDAERGARIQECDNIKDYFT